MAYHILDHIPSRLLVGRVHRKPFSPFLLPIHGHTNRQIHLNLTANIIGEMGLEPK